jgi:hypothetical protein
MGARLTPMEWCEIKQQVSNFESDFVLSVGAGSGEKALWDAVWFNPRQCRAGQENSAGIRSRGMLELLI